MLTKTTTTKAERRARKTKLPKEHRFGTAWHECGGLYLDWLNRDLRHARESYSLAMASRSERLAREHMKNYFWHLRQASLDMKLARYSKGKTLPLP